MMNSEIKSKLVFDGNKVFIEHINKDIYYWASLLYVKFFWVPLDDNLYELYIIGINPDYDDFVDAVRRTWGHKLWRGKSNE